MTKVVQQSEDLFIQFTPEELKELGCKVGDKFSCEIEGDSLKLTKHASLELDLTDYPREVLLRLIIKSIEEDISVNEVINNMLKEQIEKFDGRLT